MLEFLLVLFNVRLLTFFAWAYEVPVDPYAWSGSRGLFLLVEFAMHFLAVAL